VSLVVLDVGDVERRWVLFNVLDNSDSADVVASDGDDLGAIFVLDKGLDFVSLDVEL